MQVQQNIADFQEKFVIKLDAKIAKIVSPTDRRMLAAEYLNMFAGFSWINWTNKYSLGRAWQTALAQCGAFVETKNEKNPAAKYLKNVYGAHKKYWSRVIMTHRGRENVITPDDKQIKQVHEHGMRMVRVAMDKINLILARYNERVEELMATQAQQQQPQAPQAQQQSQIQQLAQPQVQAQAQAQPQMQQQPQAPQVPQAQQQSQIQQLAQPQVQPQAQEQHQSQQNMAKWMAGIRAVDHLQHQVAQQATKSVAAPIVQSGAFAMTRDTVKRPNTMVQDKPVELPGLPMRQAQSEKKPASVAMVQQPKQPVAMENSKELPKPIVHHAAKSVTAQSPQSGALPVLRNTVRQNVVKTVEKPQLVSESHQTPIIKLNPQMSVQQLNFQRQLQIWRLGQFKQNAA